MYVSPADAEIKAAYLLGLPPSPACDPGDLLWEQLHIILDSIHDGIWIIDGNGITTYVNKAMKRIADIEPEDVIGKHVNVPMQEGKFSSCVTLQALKEKRPVTLFDDYASGKRCLNTSTPILDQDGSVRRVVASIRDITELNMLQGRLAKAEQEVRLYKRRLDLIGQEHPGFIVGSESMRNCLLELEKAARSPSGVLLLGETGTGKSLAASIIHQKSPRASGPYITVNCAAIPASLIESELFGYEKGAFSGAGQHGKKGFFELAHTGTLLLDEIGDLPLNMQAKLLHVLDSQTFHRVGGEKSITVDVRVIAATNRPLEELVEKGEYRADLYYRLRVLTVRIPPLRKHAEDIVELTNHFLDDACKRHGVVKVFSPQVLAYFMSYSWPGNVRELRATVDFLVAMSENKLVAPSDLPQHILGTAYEDVDPENPPQQTLRAAVRNLEYTLVRNALLETGSTYKAAERLGVSQSTVMRKAQQFGLNTER
jgi:PAS domain S-box-containing protein